jgi:hypothetical protein
MLERRPTVQIPYAAGPQNGATYKQYGVTRPWAREVHKSVQLWCSNTMKSCGAEGAR